MIRKTTMLPDNSNRSSETVSTAAVRTHSAAFAKRVEAKRKRYAVETSANQSDQTMQSSPESGSQSPSPNPVERPNIPPSTIPDPPKPGDDKPASPDFPPNIHPDTEPTTTPPHRLGNWH
jgi:hypothetical protein